MQFSRNWLKEFINLKISTEELCEQLTMLGLEVDSYRHYQSKLTGEDAIIKLDLTPNRGDCFCIMGIARELAALNGKKIKLPKIKTIKSSLKSPLKVYASDEAPRYVGRYISQLDLKKKTPPLVKERLKISNIKTIDPIVDITNYVLIELGQPLHAFDSNKLQGDLRVRFAKDKEKITLIDESKIELDQDCLVIADEKKSVALAGIMGGLDTAISKETESIYLESAFFKPEVIRGRPRKFALQTEASTRFERGVDFELQTLAVKRASSLIFEVLGGEFSPIQEFKKSSSFPQNEDIHLYVENVNKTLGLDFSKFFISKLLRSLGLIISVSTDKDFITAKIPSWRFDLKVEVDLIEEIARLVGYNKLPQEPLRTKKRNTFDSLNQSVRSCFTSRGYNEVITYSFIEESAASLVEPKIEKLVFVSNPISQNMIAMRPSLLPGLLNTLSYNQNQGIDQVKIFEIGSTFQKTSKNKVKEVELIGGLISGSEGKNNWTGSKRSLDFFDLKGDVEKVLGNSSGYVFKKAELPYLHPGKTAFLFKGKSQIGYIGSLNPKLVDKLDLKHEVNFFEIQIEKISLKGKVKFKNFSRFPLTQRDLSFILDQGISSSEVKSLISSKAGGNLKEVKLFDIYEGKGIPQGKKSLTFSLSWQAADRTLTDKETDDLVKEIVKFLSKKFNAKLRA